MGMSLEDLLSRSEAEQKKRPDSRFWEGIVDVLRAVRDRGLRGRKPADATLFANQPRTPVTPTTSDPCSCAADDAARSGETAAEALSGERRARPPSTDVEKVEAVVAHYVTRRPRSRPGEKERARVRARLKDGYSVEELVDAIDGCFLSRWYQGENERGRAFNSLELICRDSSKVDQFREIKARGGDEPRTSRDVAVDAVESRFLGKFGLTPLGRTSNGEIGSSAAHEDAPQPVRGLRPRVL